jgi:type I restriction enzyme S subunit
MVEVITEHLDVWTSAQIKKNTVGRGSNGKHTAYGIKKLRELILELAVRGRLVPQDPNDEPASMLLEKITKEKTRLIKEGNIKKQTPLPEIREDEKPFGLPNGWEWVRLQDISSYIQRGKGPKYADQGQVRVVSQKCVQWSGFNLLQAKHVDDESLANYQPERFL